VPLSARTSITRVSAYVDLPDERFLLPVSRGRSAKLDEYFYDFESLEQISMTRRVESRDHDYVAVPQ